MRCLGAARRPRQRSTAKLCSRVPELIRTGTLEQGSTCGAHGGWDLSLPGESVDQWKSVLTKQQRCSGEARTEVTPPPSSAFVHHFCRHVKIAPETPSGSQGTLRASKIYTGQISSQFAVSFSGAETRICLGVRLLPGGAGCAAQLATSSEHAAVNPHPTDRRRSWSSSSSSPDLAILKPLRSWEQQA